jgi:hypothetical protein
MLYFTGWLLDIKISKTVHINMYLRAFLLISPSTVTPSILLKFNRSCMRREQQKKSCVTSLFLLSYKKCSKWSSCSWTNILALYKKNWKQSKIPVASLANFRIWYHSAPLVLTVLHRPHLQIFLQKKKIWEDLSQVGLQTCYYQGQCQMDFYSHHVTEWNVCFSQSGFSSWHFCNGYNFLWKAVRVHLNKNFFAYFHY